MSFDLTLLRFEAGKHAAMPKDAVLAALRHNKCSGPDGNGYFVVIAQDGAAVEFGVIGLDSKQEFESCWFNLCELTPGICQIVFDVADAAEAVIFNMQAGGEQPSMIAPPSFDLKQAPADFIRNYGKPPRVTSAAQLEAVLESDFSKWSELRDEVIRMT